MWFWWWRLLFGTSQNRFLLWMSLPGRWRHSKLSSSPKYVTCLWIHIRDHWWSCISAFCPYPADKNDGFCDDNNNVPSCDFDGGDCCLHTWNWEVFCIACKCHEDEEIGEMITVPSYYCTWDILVSDGFCDDITNNLICGYDGGDCCLEEVQVKSYAPCVECTCFETGRIKVQLRTLKVYLSNKHYVKDLIASIRTWLPINFVILTQTHWSVIMMEVIAVMDWNTFLNVARNVIVIRQQASYIYEWHFRACIISSFEF